MKRPKNKFQAHSMSESQVINVKKSQNVSSGQNLSFGQNFLATQFFSLYRYLLETTTAGIDMLLQV